MKFNGKDILILALGLVILVLLLLRKCDGGNQNCDFTEYHDTIFIPGDPYPIEKTVPVKEPYAVYEDKPVYIDTNRVVDDYFVKKFYLDTLQDDSSALVVVKDSIYMNRISHRKFEFQNRRSTAHIYNTNVTVSKQPAIRVGLGLTGMYQGKTKSFDVGPNLTFSTRPGFYAGYSYLVSGKSHAITVGWVLSFKKRNKNK